MDGRDFDLFNNKTLITYRQSGLLQWGLGENIMIDAPNYLHQ